jgi:hypothetical protein
MLFIKKIPAAWQAGLVLLVRPILKNYNIEVDAEKVLKELGVGRTTALDSARALIENIEFPRVTPREQKRRERKFEKQLREKNFVIDVLEYRVKHFGYVKQGDGRQYFCYEFKCFILEKKKFYELSWADVSRLLNISKETLKKFRRVKEDRGDDDSKSGPSGLPDNIRQMINKFLRWPGKKSVKEFCQNNPEITKNLNLNYREIVGWLSRLGFVSPKGIFLKNTGLDKIERFSPNCVWGTDGKNMRIVINGECFRWVWQCLIDFRTTVLVGGLLTGEETTDNLLEAIKKSKEKTGVAPMAIVLDNRLSENLPTIRQYLDEWGIQIIKTFPGNSKSNGIVENNFSIFEKWVGGTVEIKGKNYKELSLSIANVLVEVFTQLRNHQPRRGLNLKSANESLKDACPLSDIEKQKIKDRLRELANRFKNEQATPITSQRKLEAIKQAINDLSPPNPDKFKEALKPSELTADIILQALAVFKQRQQQCPEKKYTHAYFGGIVRNLANQQRNECLITHLDEVYTHHWETMARVTDCQQSESLKENPTQTCSRLIIDYLKMPVPTYKSLILIQLKSMFLLATKGSNQLAKSIRQELCDIVKKWKYENSKKISHILLKLFEWEAIVLTYNPENSS